MATKQTSILTAGTNNHQTTAEEANQFATDFVQHGVLGSIGNTNGFAPMTGGYGVNAQGTPDMTLAVNAGALYCPVTPAGQASQVLRSKMLSAENVTIAPNASGVTKYDFVYLSHNAANANNPDVAATNVATLFVSRSSNAITDDGTPPSFGELLATVTVVNGAASISAGSIRDRRTGAGIASSSLVNDWKALTAYPASFVQNDGQKQSVLKYTGVDLTGVIPLGARGKIDRLVAPPTQCMTFASASSQYATKASPTGIAFTAAYSVEGWIKPTTYTGQNQYIINRQDTAGTTGGWTVYINPSGQIRTDYGTVGGFTSFLSRASVQRGRWQHIAVCVTSVAAKTGAIYLNGVLLPATSPLSAATALTQPAIDLRVGAAAVGPTNTYCNMSISELRLWSTGLSQANVLANMGINLVGNEANLVGLWKGSGNFNDATANGNNLTAVAGAVATTTDNPYHTTEYFVVTGVALSGSDTLVTGFFGTDYVLPNQALFNGYYSTISRPFGFPSSKDKWSVEAYIMVDEGVTFSGVTTWNTSANNLIVPIGSWKIGYQGPFRLSSTVSGARSGNFMMSDVTPPAGRVNEDLSSQLYDPGAADSVETLSRSKDVLLAAMATYTMWAYIFSSSGTESFYVYGGSGVVSLKAECGYIS